MFVSFLLPSIFEGEPARHLQVFYNQLAAFGRDEIAFIGQPDYFRSPSEFEAEGRVEWQPAVREIYQFDPPTSLDGVTFEALPTDLFHAKLSGRSSSWRLYGRLMRNRMPELETAFSAALDRLQRRRQVEGVVTFVNMPSIAHVARQRGLPLIQCEYGPVRKPDYAMTGYWDRRTSGSLADATRRFRRFAKDTAGQRAVLFDREELLFTLRRTAMPDIPVPSDAPYRLGIALQGDDHGFASGIGQLDLHSIAGRRFGRDEILIRHHPAARTRCTELLGSVDSSATPTEFLAQCETILTASSGAALEALLLGRRCVVIGDSAFALAADRSFEAITRRSPREHRLALNFLVFGYIVPFELMFDADYTRWRLSDPPEIEIARHHQRWYRTRLMPAPNAALTLSTATKLLAAVSRAHRAVVVFGAGRGTPALVTRLRTTGFDPIALFDNDAAKWGTRVSGLTVEPPAYRNDSDVIVSSLTHADEIVGQLHALGYPGDCVLRLTRAAA